MVINIYIMVVPTTLIMIRVYWTKLCINVTRVPHPSSLISEKRSYLLLSVTIAQVMLESVFLLY